MRRVRVLLSGVPQVGIPHDLEHLGDFYLELVASRVEQHRSLVEVALAVPLEHRSVVRAELDAEVSLRLRPVAVDVDGDRRRQQPFELRKAHGGLA
jgi:hypothetical protein